MLVTALLLITNKMFSQVGINNQDPKSTLDITAKTTDGTKPEGVIAPRLTGDQIKSGNSQYNMAQKGTLVYATSGISSGDATGKTSYITTEGYYYFDGIVWKSMSGISGAVAFNAKLGNGLGRQVNLVVAKNGFFTVSLPTVVKNIGGGIWDNNAYTIPFTGTYLIKSTVRLSDNYKDYGQPIVIQNPTRNLFQAVGINNVDTPEGIWSVTPDPNQFPAYAPNYHLRFTMLYNRIAFFNKGDKITLYIRSEDQPANISDASLDIVSISTN